MYKYISILAVVQLYTKGQRISLYNLSKNLIKAYILISANPNVPNTPSLYHSNRKQLACARQLVETVIYPSKLEVSALCRA